MLHLLVAVWLALFGLRSIEPAVPPTLMAQLGSDQSELSAGMQVDAPLTSLASALFETGGAAGSESLDAPQVAGPTGSGALDVSAPSGLAAAMGQGRGGGEKVGGAGEGRFFGVRSAGNRFVFIVDCSGSMHDNGWDDCRRELVAAVRRLKTNQYFYVLLFCSRSYRMFDSARPEPRMAPATALNLARLERWLHGFQPHDETLPLDAVRFAMSLHPDAIYLLTDGEIQDNTAEWLAENIVRDDAYDGGSLRTVVHTIGFVSKSGQAVLQRIARDCGGTYKFAEKPPPPAPAGVRGPRTASHLSQGGTPASRSGLPAGRPRDK